MCLPANRVVLVKASSGSDGEVLGDDDQQPEARSLLTKVADSKLFNTYLHLLVFVLILGFVDAGYSRDWTRIGAISPELEQQLRDLAVVLGEVHVACALVAGAVATKRNLPVAPAVAKTALRAHADGCPWDKEECATEAEDNGYVKIAEWIRARE